MTTSPLVRRLVNAIHEIVSNDEDSRSMASIHLQLSVCQNKCQLWSDERGCEGKPGKSGTASSFAVFLCHDGRCEVFEEIHRRDSDNI